jgi:hypothetical protein
MGPFRGPKPPQKVVRKGASLRHLLALGARAPGPGPQGAGPRAPAPWCPRGTSGRYPPLGGLRAPAARPTRGRAHHHVASPRGGEVSQPAGEISPTGRSPRGGDIFLCCICPLRRLWPRKGPFLGQSCAQGAQHKGETSPSGSCDVPKQQHNRAVCNIHLLLASVCYLFLFHSPRGRMRPRVGPR